MIILSYSYIKEIRGTLDELTRMHRLNLELLDVLSVLLRRAMDFAIQHDLPVDESIGSLQMRAINLYNELTSEPLSLRHRFRNTEEDDRTGAEGFLFFV